MYRRWYDHDPTLSMAISLLQNAPKDDQKKTAQYILGLLTPDDPHQRALPENAMWVSSLFTDRKRSQWDEDTSRMMEVLKNSTEDVQMEMSIRIINYVYLLESGLVLDREVENEPSFIKMQRNQTA